MCVCICVKSCHLKLEYKLLSCILHTFFSNMRDHLEPVRFFATKCLTIYIKRVEEMTLQCVAFLKRNLQNRSPAIWRLKELSTTFLHLRNSNLRDLFLNKQPPQKFGLQLSQTTNKHVFFSKKKGFSHSFFWEPNPFSLEFGGDLDHGLMDPWVTDPLKPANRLWNPRTAEVEDAIKSSGPQSVGTDHGRKNSQKKEGWCVCKYLLTTLVSTL